LIVFLSLSGLFGALQLFSMVSSLFSKERLSNQVARETRDADRRLDAIERGYQMPPPQSDRRQ
jgi:hypothetical protein